MTRRPKCPSQADGTSSSNGACSQVCGLRAHNSTCAPPTTLEIDQSEVQNRAIPLNGTDDSIWDRAGVWIGVWLVALLTPKLASDATYSYIVTDFIEDARNGDVVHIAMG